MEQIVSCKVVFLILSLLASASSQELVFAANAGEGRYQFTYNEYAVNVDDVVISDSLPPGLFAVSCLFNGRPSNTIRYASGGGDGGLFEVDEITGALALQDGRQLDYETSIDIRFSVSCNSSLSSGTGTTQVDFRVMPVNEFQPVLSERTIFVRVREDVAIGTVLVSTRTDVGAPATFSATDADDGPDGELEFTLAFNENLTSFAVDLFSGTLTVTQNLDVDNTPLGFMVDRIRLTVCDIKPAVSSCPNVEVSIVITSANDNSPIFMQSIYRVRISEDVPSGAIIANVSCTDDDVGTGRFDNVTSSNSLFNVSRTSNEQIVALDGALDFETAQSHNVSLTCYDVSGGIARAVLQVTVEPINDNQPRFTSREYYFAMSRILTTGNEIGRVEAIDGDRVIGGDLTYTLMDNENFQIQGDGSIILTDFVYVVEGQEFTLEVDVSDGEFSDSAIVVVTVNGVLSVPEVILICMGALVFLVLVIFIIVFCCYCCVCCSRLIPKQRHVDVPVEVIKNDNAMPDGMMNAMAIPVPMMGGMYHQGKGPTYMIGQIPTSMMGTHWEAQSDEEATDEEGDVELGSIVTASSRVYSPTPYLKEMVEIFKDGDEILEGKKSKKK